MEIGYSHETIMMNIAKCLGNILSECEWAALYRSTGEIEDLEDCVADIKASTNELEEWMACLKAEEM